MHSYKATVWWNRLSNLEPVSTEALPPGHRDPCLLGGKCYQDTKCHEGKKFTAVCSTYRWTIPLTNVEVAVKRLSETRWSAHYETNKPTFKCFKKIVDAIKELCDASETIDVLRATQTLLPAMSDFSLLCFLRLWYNVFKEVNHVQKYLHILGINF
ncbi:hypothetical protein AVEN_256469-1 [Araneus ventricosus]|uniref:Uncharacterized protein n=1 Tax=Araneus ventricosus TaxID=182803 RepID=A0A4Y2H0S6_ARAVE|nr:hypothetical protein AVEN_256469-1 [Araneus ventricosus]